MHNYKFPDDQRLLQNTNIAQVHAVILRMLKIMSIICEAHNVDFWLDYGTLLGAVRHQGFIPWDDEADIGMLRSDFEKLLTLEADFPSDILLQTKSSDPHYEKGSYFIEAKLRDKYSNYVDFEKTSPHVKWHNGIQVDIFVYDYDINCNGYFTNAYERLLTNSKIYFMREELECTIEANFEDYTFQIPCGYDAYLKRNYENYMELPPIEQQRTKYIDITSPCKHDNVLYWDKRKLK